MRKGIALLSSLIVSTALAASLDISIYEVQQIGHGKSLGKITATETDYGLLFQPHLKGFRTDPSVRGFHVHEGNSCDNFGQAARGHWDPRQTGEHLGPYEAGHLGDIQALVINKDGTITLPVLAPRLTLAGIAGHTLVIHAEGDNYADTPARLGGGGDRIACGIIPVLPATKAIAAPAGSDLRADNQAVVNHERVQALMERKKKLQVLKQESHEALQRLKQEAVNYPWKSSTQSS